MTAKNNVLDSLTLGSSETIAPYSFAAEFRLCLAVGMFSPAVQQSTEILWDTYGVPHIFGKDTSSLSHAFGCKCKVMVTAPASLWSSAWTRS